MVGEVSAPGLGIDAGWDDGSDGWGAGLNSGLVRLSMIAHAIVASRTTSLPGSPTQGDMYIVPTGDANGDSIAGYHKGAWVYVTPVEGMTIYVQDDDEDVTWDGTAWVAPAAITPEVPDRVWTASAVGVTLAAGDFDGRTVRAFTGASAMNVTIPAGITPTKGCMVTQMGTGAVTLVADTGVTLLSAGNHLQLGAQYAGAVIMPTSVADEYIVWGNLTTP